MIIAAICYVYLEWKHTLCWRFTEQSAIYYMFGVKIDNDLTL